MSLSVELLSSAQAGSGLASWNISLALSWMVYTGLQQGLTLLRSGHRVRLGSPSVLSQPFPDSKILPLRALCEVGNSAHECEPPSWPVRHGPQGLALVSASGRRQGEPRSAWSPHQKPSIRPFRLSLLSGPQLAFRLAGALKALAHDLACIPGGLECQTQAVWPCFPCLSASIYRKSRYFVHQPCLSPIKTSPGDIFFVNLNQAI